MVVALTKLHDFCLNKVLNHGRNAQPIKTQPFDNLLIKDFQHITMNEHGSVPLLLNQEANRNTPADVFCGDKHFDDVP